eukprot:6467958-Amphidinium_carterae.3
METQTYQCWVDVEWDNVSVSKCTLRDAHALASYSVDKHVFMVTRKGSDEVRLADIDAKDLPAFEKAKGCECHKMMYEHEGLLPLTLEQSAWVRREKAHRIIPSRFHWRWKPESQGDTVVKTPKCRWILIGFRDPDVLTLEGESPTPQLYSLNILLQTVASKKWELFQGDLQTAFLQGEQTILEVYVAQPPEGVSGLERGQFLKMNKEIYGLVAALQRWRQTFVSTLHSLGWRQRQADPCVYVLPSEGKEKGSSGFGASALLQESEFMIPPDVTFQPDDARVPIDGVLAVLVDDILEAGTERHRSLISKLLKAFKFGKHETLKTRDWSIFNGRQVKQAGDFSISVNVHDLINSKLQTLKLSRESKRQVEAGVNEDERALMRTVLMKPNEGDVGSKAVASPDLLELSKAVEHLKAHSHLEVRFHSIPVREWCLVVLVDASPCNHKLENAIGGFIMGITNGKIHDGVDCPFSIIAWGAGKIERQCSSSLVAESFALVNALAFAEFVHSALCEMTNAAYTQLVGRRRLLLCHHTNVPQVRRSTIRAVSLHEIHFRQS